MKILLNLLILFGLISGIPAFGQFNPLTGVDKIDYGSEIGSISNSFTYWPESKTDPNLAIVDTDLFEYEFDVSTSVSDNSNPFSFGSVDVAADGSYCPVPEPTTLLLLGLGTLGMAAFRKRSKQ